MKTRGHQSSGVTGVNAATDLAEFDAILAEFDKNGAIEENMMFVNRATALAIDDMLASMNSYGAGGTSYGVFENDEDMALKPRILWIPSRILRFLQVRLGST